MATTGYEAPGNGGKRSSTFDYNDEKGIEHEDNVFVPEYSEAAPAAIQSDHTHRSLKPRHIQLIGIG
jgi:amino acid permease